MKHRPFHNAPLDSVRQNCSSESNSRSACQEISRHCWNPKIFPHVLKSPPPVHIENEMTFPELIKMGSSQWICICYNILQRCSPYFNSLAGFTCAPDKSKVSNTYIKCLHWPHGR